MFSVIMPVYNRADLVGRAIKSVIAQSRSDWEIILVDDGSSDDIKKALDEFSQDNRITIIHQENRGVSAARNRAVKMAKGRHLCFLDADDLWYENHLQTMHELIKEYPDAGFFGTCADILLPGGKIKTSTDYFNEKKDILYTDNFFKAYNEDKRAKMFQMSTSCIPAGVIERLGGFKEGCRMGEDLELSLRIAAYYPYVLTKKTTALYNRMESTASKDGAFDVDWFFFKSYKKILEDERVSGENKAGLEELMHWFEMRRCRHLLLESRRKEAFLSYKKLMHIKELKKERFINLILLFMPVKIIRFIFKRRWRKQA